MASLNNSQPSTSPTIRNKRPRPSDMDPGAPQGLDDGSGLAGGFQHEDGDEDGDDDDEDEGVGKKNDKKAGRRKIKIEFIADKSRRHITFSKRKAGIMKKAYELSTLTGTQVLLLVVSETGLVYTFTTAKLQPLVTQPEGKNLIQACLNSNSGPAQSGAPAAAVAGAPQTGPPAAHAPAAAPTSPIASPPGAGGAVPAPTRATRASASAAAAAAQLEGDNDDGNAPTTSPNAIPDGPSEPKRPRRGGTRSSISDATSGRGAAQAQAQQQQAQQQQQQQQQEQLSSPQRLPQQPSPSLQHPPNPADAYAQQQQGGPPPQQQQGPPQDMGGAPHDVYGSAPLAYAQPQQQQQGPPPPGAPGGYGPPPQHQQGPPQSYGPPGVEQHQQHPHYAHVQQQGPPPQQQPHHYYQPPPGGPQPGQQGGGPPQGQQGAPPAAWGPYGRR